MTTFAELKIGARFHYNIDADGYEPYLYKISDAEGYIEEHGSGSGNRETVKPDKAVWTWSEPVTLHNRPTEIERAALTILLQTHQDHVGLHYYIRALATGADEMRDLDRYIWEAGIPLNVYKNEEGEWIEEDFRPLREICAEAGCVCWQCEYDRDQDAFGAILDHKGRGQYPETREGRWLALMDDAALRLADAIRSYRVAGRPDGDQAHTIIGLGAPLLNVTTSLDAAVAEYHAQVRGIYAGENQDLETALRETLPGDLITQNEAAHLAGVTPQAINNAIRERRLHAYSGQSAVAHRPGDRLVSRAEVERVWLLRGA